MSRRNQVKSCANNEKKQNHAKIIGNALQKAGE
jgi:hypothetical protein